jgi:hypothetical protein
LVDGRSERGGTRSEINVSTMRFHKANMTASRVGSVKVTLNTENCRQRLHKEWTHVLVQVLEQRSQADFQLGGT